ncbi:MAG: hypothetical protein CL483_01885 [Acidobacteria bacterium]|nr:hypothetical protein [Acidobacteriota bacterium]
MEEVRFTVLGSGSAGNASYLEVGDTRLLIDCGFSARQIKQRLASIDRIPDRLDGILITHDHRDHIQGLKNLASKAKLGLPIYCNKLTAEEITRAMPAEYEFHLFETGQSFEIGTVTVESFSVPHDAVDSLGYLLRTPAGNIGYLTDLGHTTRMIADRVRDANVLLLETNHDLDLLRDSGRPWDLKQRIWGRHGHLSNEGAAEFADTVLHQGITHIIGAHLSRECNSPEMVRAEFEPILQRHNLEHVQIIITSQDKPAETVLMGNDTFFSEKTFATAPFSN